MSSCSESTKVHHMKRTGMQTQAGSSSSNSNNLPHDYAVVAGPTNVGDYTGQGAVISANDPFIGDPSAEFMLSQLWIIAGSYADSSLNTAEVGSQVYPAFHPSYNPLAPHLFIYWTRDAYQSTGCYNLDCVGFVLYGAHHHGHTISPVHI
jgi:hypothetical protein